MLLAGLATGSAKLPTDFTCPFPAVARRLFWAIVGGRHILAVGISVSLHGELLMDGQVGQTWRAH
jgi:hypothetical protein